MTPDEHDSDGFLPWRVDQIEEGVALDKVLTWRLGGRFELETTTADDPLVAWAEIVCDDERRGTFLATYHLSEEGYSDDVKVWHAARRDDGQFTARAVPSEVAYSVIPRSELPANRDWVGSHYVEGAPVLRELFDRALEIRRAKAGADRRAREADPLIDVFDELTTLGIAHAECHERADDAAMAAVSSSSPAGSPGSPGKPSTGS